MNVISTLIIAVFLLSGFPTNSLQAITEADVPVIDCKINRADKRKGEVAVCAVFRDEGDYLLEWIEYHRLVGVSHFYLYNNCSADQYWEILRPYVEKGIVELFDVPYDSYGSNDGAASHNVVQVRCYNHAIKLSRKNNTWLAIIDADEFICPVVDKTIQVALKRYGNIDSLVVYWQMYGTSNVWDLKPNELLIEKLTMKAPNNGDTPLFKSIVRPKTARCVDPHWTTVSGDQLIPNGQRFHHGIPFSSLPVDIIRINHYTNRTESFYHLFKKHRRARWGDRPSPEEERSRLDTNNAVSDPVMMQFVPELKNRLNKN